MFGLNRVLALRRGGGEGLLGGGGPRVCFLGDGESGSWKMRGEQIAAMCPDWAAIPTRSLTRCDIRQYDVFCVVKRFDRALAARLRSLGKFVVYDVVDPWRQPEDGLENDTLPRVVDFFARMFEGMSLDGVIFANRTMLDDLGHLVPNPTAIYHHYYRGMTPIRVRPVARTVGYQGRVDYLGHWGDVLRRLCRRHRLRFVTNPWSLRSLDIGFAGRSGSHGSLLATRYKSNVKLANLFGAAIPAVVQAGEMSYHETDNGNVTFFTDEEELDACLEGLLPYERRLEIHRSFVGHRAPFSIEAIAAQYREYFEDVVAGRCHKAASVRHAA